MGVISASCRRSAATDTVVSQRSMCASAVSVTSTLMPRKLLLRPCPRSHLHRHSWVETTNWPLVTTRGAERGANCASTGRTRCRRVAPRERIARPTPRPRTLFGGKPAQHMAIPFPISPYARWCVKALVSRVEIALISRTLSCSNSSMT